MSRTFALSRFFSISFARSRSTVAECFASARPFLSRSKSSEWCACTSPVSRSSSGTSATAAVASARTFAVGDASRSVT